VRAVLTSPPRLRRPDAERERHATWLELFYDLAVVVGIAQAAHLLAAEVALHTVAMFGWFFVTFWWVWGSHTVYATRFDTDDTVYRLLTLTQMFALLLMGAFTASAEAELPSAAAALGWQAGQSSAFGVAYVLARLCQLALLARAYYHLPSVRGITGRTLAGFCAALCVWLAGFLDAGTVRVAMWSASLAIDLFVPWWVRARAAMAVGPSHLPERLGLFTMIVLGEALVSLVRGVAEANSPLAGALGGTAGFCVIAVIWWLYFRHLERTIGRLHLATPQPYIYAHLPVHLAIVLTGVAIETAIHR
jgi:low temperature requirement protein LtrA